MSEFDYEELTVLVYKSLDNEISEDEFSRLSEIISNDIEAQQAYLELVDMHTALHDTSLTRIINSKSKLISNKRRASKTVSVKTKKKKHLINFRFISIAAVLALAAILIYKINSDKKEDTFGIIVTDSQNARLTGQKIKRWHKLYKNLIELRSGLITLQSPKGVRFTLQGPARLKILSADHTQLFTGKILAFVPPNAKGFSVTVGNHKVVDLGTCFGIEAAGKHELHVFEGSVELKNNSVSSKLEQGKAVKFSKHQKPESISLNLQKFRLLEKFSNPVSNFNFEKGLNGWNVTKTGEFFDRKDQNSSELTKGNLRFVQSNSSLLSNENTFSEKLLDAHSSTGRILPMPFYARDMSKKVIVLSSPPFTLQLNGGDIEAFLHGGCGAVDKLQGTLSDLGENSSKNGFLGIALRRVSDNTYVASARRTARVRETFRKGWEKVIIPTHELNSVLEKSRPGEKFILDLVDSFSTEEAIWTWTALDTVTIPGKFEKKE